MKRFRQFDRAEHVCDALEVICHCREPNFDLCTGQAAHQQTRMSEDTVLDRDGHEDSGSPNPASRSPDLSFVTTSLLTRIVGKAIANLLLVISALGLCSLMAVLFVEAL